MRFDEADEVVTLCSFFLFLSAFPLAGLLQKYFSASHFILLFSRYKREKAHGRISLGSQGTS
jgi:hypothetical protein